jgi:hypothetical protein
MADRLTERVNVTLDADTLKNLSLIAAHLSADPERGRSQAIRFAAAQAVRDLGLGLEKAEKKKSARRQRNP